MIISQLLKLKVCINDAGGVKAVGVDCGVSYQAVQKWLIHGLPRTECSGETNYAVKICDLAVRHGFVRFLPSDLIEESVSYRKLQAQQSADSTPPNPQSPHVNDPPKT